jgi:hypothetical protein
VNKFKHILNPALVGVALVPIISGFAWAASSSVSSTPLITPNDPEQSTTLPQRIAQRKTALKLNLSSVQSADIAKKCAVAQTGLQQIKTKDQTVAANRQQIYSDLATQLNQMVDHLDRQSIDSATLKAAQTKFNNGVNQYLSDYEIYKTAMDDVVVMDCANDPAGFEATLQSARQLRSQLANNTVQVKAAVPALSQALNADKQNLINRTSSTKQGASQ